MDHKRILVLGFSLLGMASASGAGINRWVDEQGNVHFGDIPPSAVAAEGVRLKIRPVDRVNGRLLKKSAKGWLKNRLAGNKASDKSKESSGRDYSQRLRYKNARRKGQLMVGMRPDEVRSMLGKPTKTSASSGSGGVRELWTYIRKDKKQLSVTLQDGKVSGWR